MPPQVVRVGFDAFGDTLIHALGSDGVDTSRVQRDADEPTRAALILVERGGQNMIALAPAANARAGIPEVERGREVSRLKQRSRLQHAAPVARAPDQRGKDLPALLRVTMLENRAARYRAYAQRRTRVEHIAGCHDDHSRTTMSIVANRPVSHFDER